MSIILADKSLAAIERALRADQGARFRTELGIAIQQCDDAFDGSEQSPFRSHLGASLLGRECYRELWYNFRWVKKSKHIGQTIRLFNRGHLEEARFVALIRMCGWQIWQVDKKGKQFRISDHGGHYGSAIDGVIKGIPEFPDEPVMGEFKTSNDKNFAKMKKMGVAGAKPEHVVQMRQYMKYMKLRACLYLVVNKNTDELYGEIIMASPEQAEMDTDKAGRIVFSQIPPERLYDNSASFGCKFCDFRDICFKGAGTEVNCRTCQYSEPLADGSWRCNNQKLKSKTLSKADQLKGCNLWSPIDGMSSNEAPKLPVNLNAFGTGLLQRRE